MELKKTTETTPKIYRISIASLWIVNKRIIAYEADEGADDNLERAHETKEMIKMICKENSLEYPIGVYVNLNGLTALSRQARFTYMNASDIIKAATILTQTPLARIFGNFVIGINRAKFPIKLFTDEREALAWLNQQVS